MVRDKLLLSLTHSLTDAPLTHDVCFHSTMVGIILDCRHRYGQLQIQQRSGQLSSKRTFLSLLEVHVIDVCNYAYIHHMDVCVVVLHTPHLVPWLWDICHFFESSEHWNTFECWKCNTCCVRLSSCKRPLWNFRTCPRLTGYLTKSIFYLWSVFSGQF